MHILFCNKLFLLETTVNPLVDEQADREAFHTWCFQGKLLSGYIHSIRELDGIVFAVCARDGESKGER